MFHNKKVFNITVFFSIIFLFLIISGCSIKSSETVKSEPKTEEAVEGVQSENEGRTKDDSNENVKKFEVVAKQFVYQPEVIEVELGDKVIIEATSADVPHSFTLLDFGDPKSAHGGINELLESGKTTTIEFVADKKGEFEFGCDVVCGSGHSKMKGKFIVK